MPEREIISRWKKSSYSGNQGGACVETAALVQAVGVRDSKDIYRGHLTIPAGAWGVLTVAIKR